METDKKTKYRKLIRWLLIDLAITAIILALLLYRPSRYYPQIVDSNINQQGRVEPYIMHLSSELYNGAQREEPFELEVIELNINQTIAHWSAESEGVIFTAPKVLFVPRNIVIMGTAEIKSAQFVVTIALEPTINEKRLLDIQVVKVKIGAMNITPLAKMIAKQMYQERLEMVPIDIQDIRSLLAGSILNEEPFYPVFNIENKKVRLDNITVTQGKLTLFFIPVS